MWWQPRAWTTLPARLLSPLSLKTCVRLGERLSLTLSVSLQGNYGLSLVVSCSLNISADSCVFNDIMIKIILCQKQLSHTHTHAHSCTRIAKDIWGRTPTEFICVATTKSCCHCFSGFFNWGANERHSVIQNGLTKG